MKIQCLCFQGNKNMTRSMNKIVVDFFYDVISPYSYIAFENLAAFTKHSHIDLKLKPVLIGGIMQHTDNQPPSIIPAKAEYMSRDLLMLSKYHKIPLKLPKDIRNLFFAKGSLDPQRLLTATKIFYPHYLEALSKELFLRVWLKDLDVSTSESLHKACQDANISAQDTRNLMSAIKQTEIKNKLKEQTQQAIDYGAFGVPTYVAHLAGGSEMFFGSDRLYLLAHYLNISYP